MPPWDEPPGPDPAPRTMKGEVSTVAAAAAVPMGAPAMSRGRRWLAAGEVRGGVESSPEAGSARACGHPCRCGAAMGARGGRGCKAAAGLDAPERVQLTAGQTRTMPCRPHGCLDQYTHRIIIITHCGLHWYACIVLLRRVVGWGPGSCDLTKRARHLH